MKVWQLPAHLPNTAHRAVVWPAKVYLRTREQVCTHRDRDCVTDVLGIRNVFVGADDPADDPADVKNHVHVAVRTQAEQTLAASLVRPQTGFSA